MKKFYFLILLAISVALFSSCGNDDDGDKNQFLHGTYKMVITQTGDLNDFSYITSLSGGNGLNNGIFNEQGEDLGMNYQLTNAENLRSSYSYHTAEDGALMIFTQLATCEDLTKSVTTKVEVYFNGNLIDTKERTFKGTDTSVFQVSWSQIK